MNGYDPLAVAFYDIAHEGAQIRAIAGAIESSIDPVPDAFGVIRPGLASLAGVRARSIVLLCADDLSAKCAQLAVAMAQPLAVPLVVTDSLPGYIGALDVLIVLSEKGEDQAIARAMSHAVTRGVPTVLVAPGESPLATNAPNRAIIIPHLPNSVGPSPMRGLCSILAVLELADLDVLLVVQKLHDWAAGVDEELESCSPERDHMVNPARQLAQLNGTLVHSALHPVGRGVADLAATLWAMNGRGGSVLSMPELMYAQRNFPQAQPDIFYDPLLDPSPGLLPLKAVVWCAPDNQPPGPPGSFSVTISSPLAPSSVLRLVTRAFAATAFFSFDSTDSADY
ncbi:hypothetical protein CMUST_03835 [Corynebacterium mustelae]|uniref:Uncharacterized protein n=1 Tax=Corynebacterium mustelae TaxID=571915 RepID=A0A0G3GVE3_9CORY|nr:hypothetical protein [Corynebacterium mustelae]AKK05111.1 hypothetical protein CMUST_03835 [Corynebacterium mustelae]